MSYVCITLTRCSLAVIINCVRDLQITAKIKNKFRLATFVCAWCLCHLEQFAGAANLLRTVETKHSLCGRCGSRPLFLCLARRFLFSCQSFPGPAAPVTLHNKPGAAGCQYRLCSCPGVNTISCLQKIYKGFTTRRRPGCRFPLFSAVFGVLPFFRPPQRIPCENFFYTIGRACYYDGLRILRSWYRAFVNYS